MKDLDAIIENYLNHPEQYLSPDELAAAQAENEESEATEAAVDFAITKTAAGKWKILNGLELPKFYIPPPQGKMVIPQNTLIKFNNPFVLIVPSNSPLMGMPDFYYYLAEDKRLLHISPQGKFISPPGDDDFDNWSVLKSLLIERNPMPYSNVGEFPNLANYFIYAIRIKESVVEKDELISWLGDYITDEANNLFVADVHNTLSLTNYGISTKQFNENEFKLLNNDQNENADEELAEPTGNQQNKQNNTASEMTSTEIENPLDTIELKEHAQNEYRGNNLVELSPSSLQQTIYIAHLNDVISLEEVVSEENIVSQNLCAPEILPITAESLPIIPLEQQPKSEFY